MHMSGVPVAALVAIIVFALLCVFIGIVCLIAAFRQRTAEAPGALAGPPRETLSRESFADGIGVVAYRLFNRVLISAIGGGILIALFGKAKSRVSGA